MPNGTGSIVSAGTATPSDPGLVAEKVVRHLFNYLSSFSTALTPDSAIPLGVITRWYESFLTKAFDQEHMCTWIALNLHCINFSELF